MSSGRGLPLLSGPPPPNLESTRPEMACRKCNKEFNIIFARPRKCNHCGYSYCHNCTDYQALMPRVGSETGYDVMNVCAYCIEYLTITAGGRNHLKSLPLAKLKKYVNAYNIKIDRAVEKDDFIDAILDAKSHNGCLPRENETFYRKYSVPDRLGGSRPRGLFSRTEPASPPTLPPRPATQQPTYDFPRPDLTPDDHHPQHGHPGPSPYSYNNTPPPTPPRPHSAYNHPPHRPSPPPPPPRPQHNVPPPQHAPYHGHNHGAPPTPPQASRPQFPYPPHHNPGPYQNPNASRSSHHIPNPTPSNHTPSRPRAASAAPRRPPTPPPALDELINMTADAIASLSISALKSILFTNHVNAGQILEKGDLVKKVKDLVNDERRERERQRLAEELEEQERIERQRVMMEEHKRVQREREAARLRAEQETSGEEGAEAADGQLADDGHGAGAGGEAFTAPPPPPPGPQAMAANPERASLCVICQDDEANIAIVDCGHLAMCRGCSDLVMASSRECPLCRTRIVTEARLLRIFKT